MNPNRYLQDSKQKKALQESTIVTLSYFLKVVVVVITLMMKIMGFICSIFDGFLQIHRYIFFPATIVIFPCGTSYVCTHLGKQSATVLSDVKTQIRKVDMSN